MYMDYTNNQKATPMSRYSTLLQWSLLALFSTLLFLGALFAHVAHAQQEPQVVSMNINMQINPAGELEVTENITYDFGTQEQSGFMRKLPGDFSSLSQITVSNVSRDGLSEEYQIERGERYTRIIIGQSDIELAGQHDYSISYSVPGAVTSNDGQSTLRWPLIVDSGLPASNIIATLSVPPEAVISATCQLGSSGPQCPVEKTDNGLRAQVDRVSENSRLTLTATLEAGTVASGQASGYGLERIVALGALALASLLFLIGFVVVTYRRFWLPRTDKPATTPPSQRIEPLFVGKIIDGKLHGSDLAGALVQLARQGAVQITHKDEKSLSDEAAGYSGLEIKLTSGPGWKTKQLTRMLLAAVFGKEAERGATKRLSQLVNSSTLQDKMPRLEQAIEKQLMDMGVISFVYRRWRFWFGAAAVLAIIAGLTISGTWLWWAFMVGVGNLIVAILWPIRTRQGQHLRKKLRQFGWYLQANSEGRAYEPELNKPIAEDFLRWLPFAVSFGVEREWASQFRKAHLELPHWHKRNTEDIDAPPALLLARDLRSLRSVAETWETSSFSAPSRINTLEK